MVLSSIEFSLYHLNLQWLSGLEVQYNKRRLVLKCRITK